ncbi:MAG TPA: ATP-binding protein [Thermoanaerobaculia bacterium]|nr:ATP-binding protein [Thermoanaerobaculia bacterium]
MDLPVQPSIAAVDLEEVFPTAELSRRPARPPDHAAENRALVALAQEMASSPEGILQKLVDTALTLCGADSAGISLLEEEDGGEIFRWHAIAGQFAPHLLGILPRDFSPCGIVLDRNSPQMISRPERYFTNLVEAFPPIIEGLLIPFAAGGPPIGTIWVLAHSESRKFDAEDARVLGSLAKFAGAAHQALTSLGSLKAAQQRLEEADRRKDEFLAVLAHELRNPLAPVCNAVEILSREDAAEADRRRARCVIDRQTRQMVRLVDDLLDVSRISRGRIELRKQRVDLAAVVQSAVETSRPPMEAAGHQLTVTLPSGPVPLEADPTRLAQVISNLLNNAAKYTAHGGQVFLSAEWEGGEAVVRVRDSGIGIPRPMLSRIFDMFIQADSSLERAHGGLGIGLALARRLIEMHGGTLEAFSAGPGLGSEFVARCPVAGETAKPLEGPERGAGAAAAKASRRRVLVVDDNEDAAESLGVLLEMMGHEVRTAYNGLEAVAKTAEFVPDVVLLDIGLPGMNGYEAARRIRQQPSGGAMRLVALTGWGQEEDKRRSREAGFDLHVTKPLDPALLERLLTGSS